MKLRRYLRLKRLEDIHQIGYDRVIDMKFGYGENAYHIILELYGQGNIILTDYNYEILSLLRSHQFEEDVAVKVGEIYPLRYTTSMTHLAEDRLQAQGSIDDGGMDAFIADLHQAERDAEFLADADKKTKKKALTLKQFLLSKASAFASSGPDIIEHCLTRCGFASSIKVGKFLSTGRDEVRRLLVALSDAESVLASLDQPHKGFVICKDAPSDSSLEEFIEFVPCLFAQHEQKKHLEFDTFEEAVDHYFGRIEEQKLQKQAAAAEEAARRKIEKVTLEQQSLLSNLSKAQADLEEQASLVELHAEEVDKVCLVLNSGRRYTVLLSSMTRIFAAVSSGMSWEDIADMVAAETKKGTSRLSNKSLNKISLGNPVASLIDSLKLEKNVVVLRLEDPYYDEDGVGGDKVKLVEIDLSLSAHANARNLYVNRKHAKIKEQKTAEASVRVIHSVEAAAQRSLEAQRIKRNLNVIRHVHWFEKFNWFITSEGYLCLSGRDAQQNELLVKRYMRPKDIYVHADLAGAASCVLRCKDGSDFVSPYSIQQAGAMAVCRSGAWSSKAMVGSYWVYANQVSKSAPSGEYLVTGSFMIYGKKNYIAPMPLEMGFGILFRLDDESVPRHLGDRRIRGVLGDDSESLVSSARSGITSIHQPLSRNDDEVPALDEDLGNKNHPNVGEADLATYLELIPQSIPQVEDMGLEEAASTAEMGGEVAASDDDVDLAGSAQRLQQLLVAV